MPATCLPPTHHVQFQYDMRLKSSILFRRRPPPACPSLREKYGHENQCQGGPISSSPESSGGPMVTDSESRSTRWEIMVWSKTMSSRSRVSARIAGHILGHTEPQSHRSDPAFHWITELRLHWPPGRYPVTNLPVLISTQSNDAASKSGPAACSWEKGEIKEGGMDIGVAGRAI